MPEKIKTYYRQNLPHYHPVGACFFVTFRLADSLPVHIVKELQENYEKELVQSRNNVNTKELLAHLRSEYFGKYEIQLDRKPYGNCYLEEPNVASILESVIKEKDSIDYELVAYCLMPNHVHILIDLYVQLDEGEVSRKGYVQLPKILKRIKGKSARLINVELGRRGRLWAKESYDHYIRNPKEYERVIAYILNNPVKAGLVSQWKDWQFSYVKIQD